MSSNDTRNDRRTKLWRNFSISHFRNILFLFSRQCLCLVSIVPIPEPNNCNHLCEENKQLTCGGPWVISVYATNSTTTNGAQTSRIEDFSSTLRCMWAMNLYVCLIHLVQGDGEGVPTSMSCADGSVIRVLVAFYGNIMNGRNCRSTVVLAKIRSLCDQKQVII